MLEFEYCEAIGSKSDPDEAPELDSAFFADAALTRPGENLIDSMRAEPEGLKALQGWEALKLLQEGAVLMCCLAGGWGKVRLAPPLTHRAVDMFIDSDEPRTDGQLKEIQVFQPGLPEKFAWLPVNMDITGFLSFSWRLPC